jgi:type I restriction enzyme S subunit
MVRGFPKKGDILLTTEAPLGLVAKLDRDKVGIAQRLLTLRGKEKYLLNDFLLYYLMSNEGQHQLTSRETGTTVKGIKQKEFRKCLISLPPYEEQKAIARILSTLDEKIEVNNQINKTLENMAQAIFKQWFVDFEFPNEDGEPYKSSGGEMIESELGMIPKGWVVKELGDVVEFQNGYAFKSKDLLDKEQGDCYHVFKMGHIIKGGGLNKEGTKSFVPKKDCLTLARYLIKKGDLLMCMTDMKSNVALLGHTALMDEDDKYILNQRVGLLRTIDPSIINYPYLYILSNSKDFIENLRSRANSGVQVNLSTKEIKETLIIVPSKHIHKKYNDITEKVFAKSFNIAKENEVLKNARDTLLPKLMSGEIRVPFDEEGEVS